MNYGQPLPARLPRPGGGVLNGTSSTNIVPGTNSSACASFKASWRSKTICQNCNQEKKLHPSGDG